MQKYSLKVIQIPFFALFSKGLVLLGTLEVKLFIYKARESSVVPSWFLTAQFMQ